MAYDDQAYVDAYRERGEFPVIHKHITALFRRHVKPETLAYDLGACTGLLSIAMQQFCHSVVGFEANAASLAKAPPMPAGVGLRHARLGPDDVQFLRWLETDMPHTVVMRRVLPEISGGSVQVAQRFIARLHEAEVQRLVIEGRVFSARTTHVLGNLSKEIEACSRHFTLAEVYHNCAALVRR